MKIGFLDLIDWDYRVESVYEIPLGGTQSAICYLAQELAKKQEVFLLNNTTEVKNSYQVVCLPLPRVSKTLWEELDVLVISNVAGEGQSLKNLLSPGSLLILWNQHDLDQPPIQKLADPQDRDSYDGIAFVSNWQRERFLEHFKLEATRSGVMANAVSYYFREQFKEDESIVAHKSKPPILAYTSTPFRGLDLLLEVFPRIRRAIPGTRLKVFSSMKVYQVDASVDQLKYGDLYRRCLEIEGVEYVGSVPQAQLAKELKSVSVLAYPNTFAETSCIAVMEAMASGCRVITSDWGALKETTAGFADLITVDDNWSRYKDEFVSATIAALEKFLAEDTTDLESYLKKQVNYVNTYYNWSQRAQQWLEWLGDLALKNQEAASSYFETGDYNKAIELYLAAIKFFPENLNNYWYLGLSYLLSGFDDEAENIWISTIFDENTEKMQNKTEQLKKVLLSWLARLAPDSPHIPIIESCLQGLDL